MTIKKPKIKTIGTAVATGGTVAILAVATPFIGQWEGLRTKAYYDVGGVLTVCYGETENVTPDTRYTEEQCKHMLNERVKEFYAEVDELVEEDMPPARAAAVTSFAYNIGIDAFRKSTMRKKLNAGDIRGACEQLDRWVYVGRMYVRGLANRRAAEKELCLDGLPENV